ncbi:ATP-grasp domain-containing protein [Streptomyces sp. AN091965]|uniref:ATP-grasp domain-containing protein n=1 Tax=Streptomyces sp. AN091965 TaxID=2927803 RepID=UPI0035A8CE86
MDPYGHQARELFEEHGILVPRAEVATSAKEARAAAEHLGGRVIVKAQVKAGGRGKPGGVKRAAGRAAAEQTARQILGMDIKGHTVRAVLLAQRIPSESEFYVSYVLDRPSMRFLAIASARGGTDIEDVTVTCPEAMVRVPVDPAGGGTRRKADAIAASAGLPAGAADVLIAL